MSEVIGDEVNVKRDEVKNYYGKVLQQSADLKTSACTTQEGQTSAHFRQMLKDVHPDVLKRYYGCGIPIPDCLLGLRVLDLGSGCGRDCFILSKLVGQNGSVTGIDMTDEQVEFAKKYVAHHTEKYGFTFPNVNFITSYIEDLQSAGLESNYFDLVVSNCVINLSPDKEAVFGEVHRVLKAGGEFYFSDIYSNKQLNEEQQKNKVLWGECISGALYWRDFIEISTKCGFSEPRLVESHIINITNKELKPLIGDVKFVSATYRLLKLPEIIQNPGQVVYLGTIESQPKTWKFDRSLSCKVGEPQTVDAATRTFVTFSRFCEHFKLIKEGIPIENIPKNIVDPFIGLNGCQESKKACCC